MIQTHIITSHKSLFSLPPVDCCCFCHYFCAARWLWQLLSLCCFLGCRWLIVAALLHCCCFFAASWWSLFCHCSLIFLPADCLLSFLLMSLLLSLIADGWLLPLLPLFQLFFNHHWMMVTVFVATGCLLLFFCHQLIVTDLSLLVECCCFYQCCSFFATSWLSLFLLQMVDCCRFALPHHWSSGVAPSPCIWMHRVASGCKGLWRQHAAHRLIVF